MIVNVESWGAGERGVAGQPGVVTSACVCPRIYVLQEVKYGNFTISRITSAPAAAEKFGVLRNFPLAPSHSPSSSRQGESRERV